MYAPPPSLHYVTTCTLLTPSAYTDFRRYDHRWKRLLAHASVGTNGEYRMGLEREYLNRLCLLFGHHVVTLKRGCSSFL